MRVSALLVRLVCSGLLLVGCGSSGDGGAANPGSAGSSGSSGNNGSSSGSSGQSGGSGTAGSAGLQGTAGQSGSAGQSGNAGQSGGAGQGGGAGADTAGAAGTAGASGGAGGSGAAGGAGTAGSAGAGGGIEPTCGNSVLDGDEECDDGNANNRDGCSAYCRIPRLALGRDHSCALERDGSVVCWGRAEHGELGDGTFHTADPRGLGAPVPVSTLANPAAIVAGQYHTCALSPAGAVQCFGLGNYGQLGDGSFHTLDMGGLAAPGPVALSGVKQVSAAMGDHTCAVLASGGGVECWGFNLFGQLGNDSQDNSDTPVPVAGLTGVVQVAAGQYQTCALLADKTVQCWGDGGLNGGSPLYVLVPKLIAGLSGVVELAAGGSFTCGLLSDHSVRCWGEGDVGQLGDGLSNDSYTTPATVSMLSDVAQISAGRLHACALLRNGSVRCWGGGAYGQLGDGSFHSGFPDYVTTPVPATVFSNVVEIACGGDHTCALKSDHTVICVGRDTYGQLGDGMFQSGSTAAVTAATL